MDQLDSIPVVELRMRPSTFQNSIGSQLIETSAINALVQQASDRYENDSKIKFVDTEVQIVVNDTLYEAIFFLDDTTDDHEDRCAAIDWAEAHNCVSTCTWLSAKFQSNHFFCSFTIEHRYAGMAKHHHRI